MTNQEELTDLCESFLPTLHQLLEAGATIPEESRARLHALTSVPNETVKPLASRYEEEAARRATDFILWFVDNKILPEPERARLHAATRKMRITYRDLHRLYPFEALYDSLTDLTDRYEEIGKYAPAERAE